MEAAKETLSYYTCFC